MGCKAIAPVAVAAALVLGGACSDGGGEDEAVLESRTAGEGDDSATTTPADDDRGTRDAEPSEDPGEAEAQGESTGAGGSLGHATGQLHDRFDTSTVPVAIEVTSLERNGQHVELGMTLTVEVDDAAEGFDFCICDSLSDTTESGGRYDLSGIRLIDQDEQMAYLPILDSAGVCVCSSDLTGGMMPGDSVELSATFGGLSTDIETVDLEVPGLSPVPDLAIQG